MAVTVPLGRSTEAPVTLRIETDTVFALMTLPLINHPAAVIDENPAITGWPTTAPVTVTFVLARELAATEAGFHAAVPTSIDFPGPVGPVGPVAPVDPVGPVGPVTWLAAPVGPVAPAFPWIPCSPCGPVGPVAPVTP